MKNKWACQQKLGSSSVLCNAFASYYTIPTRQRRKFGIVPLCEYHALEHTRFYAAPVYSQSYNLGFDDLGVFNSFDDVSLR
jgi:hypothetical protein